MRRDTKLAIVVAVVFVGIGAWYVLKDRLPGSSKGEVSTPVAKDSAAKPEPGTAIRNTNKPRETSTPTRSTHASRTLRDTTSAQGPLAATSRERTVGQGGGLQPSAASPVSSGVMPNRPVAAPPVTPDAGPSRLSATTQPALGLGSTERPRPTLAPAVTPTGTGGTGSTGLSNLADSGTRIDSRKLTGAAMEKPSPQPTAHVIQQGDNFTSLAVKYFGHAKYANLIAKANPNVNPRRMAIGLKITIPPAPEGVVTAGTGPASVAASPLPPAGPGLPSATPARTLGRPGPVPADRAYTVKAGEGWYTLAQRFLGDGTRWTELYELNKERVPRNPHNIPPGATIELPKEAKLAAEPATQPVR